MPADDRDTKFERALEQHLRAGSLAAGCPDAETLAAYHERSLSLEEMAHWKLHIAGCAQCQETLSLVEVTEKQLAEDWEEQPIPVLGAAGAQAAVQTMAAKTDAPAPIEMTIPAARAARQRPALVRWAIPLGAAAAGVLIWIGIHEQRLLQHGPTAGSVQVAENRRESAPAPSVNYDVAPKAQPPVARDQLQVARNEREAHPGRVPAEKESGGAGVAGSAVADALQKDDIARKKLAAPEPPALVGGMAAATAAPSPAPVKVAPKPQPPAVATETVEVTGAAPQVDPAKNPVDLPAAGAANGGALDQKHIAAMNKAKSAPQQSAADANTNKMMYSQGLNKAILQASTLTSGVIVTPNNKVWWKIGANGSVELTTDAGKNWKTLGTGVTAQLTMGSAPSSKVCWIAGQDGALLLTTDRGGHWKSLTTPITGNLGGVHAIDAKHATIWDTANRLSYETSDGGTTWKQVANE